MKLEEFIQQIGGMGLNEEEILGAIKQLYLVGGEIPEWQGSREQRKLGNFKFPDSVVEILKKFHLVVDHTVAIGSGEKRIYFISLNMEGMLLGHQIIVNEIRQKRNELENILSEYPKEFLFVVVGATTSHTSARPRLPDGRRDNAYLVLPPKRFDDVPTTENLAKEITNMIGFAETDFSMKIVGDRIEEYVKRYGYVDSIKIIKQEHLPQFAKKYSYIFCQVVACHPMVYEHILSLFNDLATIGLAESIPVYDSRGHYIRDVFYSPPEVALFILSRIKNKDVPEELMERFLELIIILKGAYERDFNKGNLLEYVKVFDLSEDVVRDIVNSLAFEGVTSKYNDFGDMESPPFVVINHERMEKKVIESINSFAQQMLQ